MSIVVEKIQTEEKDKFLGRLSTAMANFAETGAKTDYTVLIEIYKNATSQTLTSDNEKALLITAQHIPTSIDLINSLYTLMTKCDSDNQSDIAETYSEILIKALNDASFPWTDSNLTKIQNKHLYAFSNNYKENEAIPLQEETLKHIKTANKALLATVDLPRQFALNLNMTQPMSFDEFENSLKENCFKLKLKTKGFNL